MRIGVPQSDYNAQRNIVGALPWWAKRVRPLERCRLITAIRYRLRLPPSLPSQFGFADPYVPAVDLLHFFNSVAESRTPWVTTFETSLPRWGEVSRRNQRRGLDLALSASCRRLFALSDAALQIALRDWRAELTQGEMQALTSKTEVLLPPQPILCSARDKPEAPTIDFAFVGADLYRKGGLEFIKALQRLQSRGITGWSARIIGRLNSFGDYASRTDRSHAEQARKLLDGLGSLVRQQDRATPGEVMEVLKRSHFFVFPTLADTFGYSALEAKACGAIVISTNVRALPEINSPRTGMVIELPLDERREFHRFQDIEAGKRLLTDALESCLIRAMNMSTSERIELADAATAQLGLQHDPNRHSARLAETYLAAIGA